MTFLRYDIASFRLSPNEGDNLERICEIMTRTMRELAGPDDFETDLLREDYGGKPLGTGERTSSNPVFRSDDAENRCVLTLQFPVK
jgi:hypothetical protein